MRLNSALQSSPTISTDWKSSFYFFIFYGLVEWNVTSCFGYSLWQQAGRSGRRKKASISVYVAFEDPIDQYFMRFPHKLFHEPMECCKVNSQNVQVLSLNYTTLPFLCSKKRSFSCCWNTIITVQFLAIITLGVSKKKWSFL